VVALGNYRQRGLGIRTEQHLLFGEGVDGAQMTESIRLEMHRAFLDLPVHTGFTLPYFNGLFLGKVIAQAVPRGSADVGHLFDEMSHG
jgi:hypothetical protein